ncbi:MAG: LytTR family DNA-binding domain-containing protein [Holophagales bacterium]|nr:LytTR family DNA-binding domain-containing protein [Holophagales bacterium]
MPIRTILIDDEPLAREKLRTFLKDEPDIEILTECRDGKEAVETVDAARPDLIFLDVQMPELDGFEVLDNLEPESMPTVIFTTAYDQYALKAFEVHAVDYLLKPFDRNRFSEALARARKEVERSQLGDVKQQLLALLREVGEKRPQYPARIVVKSSGKVVFLKVEDLDWVDAAGNYVKLHVGGESHLLRETMTGLEKRLDPSQFIRIHRSTIVNIERIKELQQQFHGDYLVVLEAGQRLTLSRSYREKIQQLLDRAL